MTSRTIDRKELHAAIWAEPATVVAARLGITSTALAKICRKLNVPTPPRGYWARVAAGHKPPRVALPRARAEAPAVHTLPTGLSATRPPISVEVAAERARPRIVVPEPGAELHPLIKKFEARLRRRRGDADLWADGACIDVCVSSGLLDRALRIMHAVVSALADRGLATTVTRPTEPPGEPRRSVTQVVVVGVPIHFSLHEEYREVDAAPSAPAPPAPPPPVWTTITGPRRRTAASTVLLRKSVALSASHSPMMRKTEATGRLCLRMDHSEGWLTTSVRRQFRDTETLRVEDSLNRFVTQLYVLAEVVLHDRLRRAREAEKRQREAAEWEERERARAREARLQTDFAERVATFRWLVDARDFIQSIESPGSVPPDVAEWIVWAREQVHATEHELRDVETPWNVP